MKLPIYSALVAFIISGLLITNTHTAQTALRERLAKLKNVTEQLATHLRSGNQDRDKLENLLNQWKDELKKNGIVSEPEQVKAITLDLRDGKNVTEAQEKIKDMASEVRKRANELQTQAYATAGYRQKMRLYDGADLLKNYVLPVIDTIVGSLKVEPVTVQTVTQNQAPNQVPNFKRRINMGPL